MFRFLARLGPLMLLMALMGASVVLAQSNGRFTGRVTDPDGGVIPNASVQAVNQETLVKREAKTDASGAYTFDSMPPGQYQIIVEAQGFRRRMSGTIALVAGQVLIFNAQMSINSADTEVTVNGAATAVELSTASISTTISNKEVVGYGLNGRNFSQLLTLAPGVSNQTGQDEAKVGVAGSAKFSVNGGRVEYNTFEIDGSDVLNTSINASRGQGEPLMVYPSIDAIQDMQVLTSNYSALYGKSSSGSVLVTTKSGTNEFHGNLYGFVRNEMFNARNYFDQPRQTQFGPRYYTPLYRRLDVGGTIGGPLFIPRFYNVGKTKTFFFFSEEVRREKTPVPYNQAVPTMAERSGDFSDVCPVPLPGYPGFLNLSKNPDCPLASIDNSGNLIAGPTVSVGYMSAALLNSGIIPAPNAVLGCNTTNPTALPRCYTTSVSPPTHWREELFRIDHYLTKNEALSFRYIHDAWDTVTLAPQWGVVQNSFPTVENSLNGPGLNLVLSLAQTLPHAFLNRLTASYSVEHISLEPQAGPGVTSLDRPGVLDNPAALGGTPVNGAPKCALFSSPGLGFQPSSITECPMGYIFNNGFGGGKMPGLVFGGSNGAYGGHGFAVDTGYAPWNQANPTYTLRDDAGKTIAKHNLQFGVEATYVQQNELSAVSGANSGDLQGLLKFSNQQSSLTSGNAFADFLAGPAFVSKNAADPINATHVQSFTQDSAQAKYYNRYKELDLYLQDDWRADSRLVINLGLRTSLLGAWYNARNTAYNWRPEAYNPSLGSSIYVSPQTGYLVRNGGTPLPLNLGKLDPVITNGLIQCGVNGVPSSCMKNTIFHPEPRIGLSWDPLGNGKLAIRAGYGLFWEHGTGYEANTGSLIGSAPLVLSETQSNFTKVSANDFNVLGYSCQQGAVQCGTAPPAGGVTFPLNVTSIPTRTVYAYTQQWSLSVQREVNKNMLAQIAYVGTKGTHLTAVRDLNQLQPLSSGLNPFAPGQPLTASVCASVLNTGVFAVNGTNTNNGPITIPSSPGIGPASPGYANMIVACTGNPGFAGGGTSADSMRPYAGFSNIISVENIADAEYHALQGTLRQTTGPLTLGLAYTYSHSLDDSSDRASANFANSLDIHSNHASSDFDQRHLLNVSYIYDLPLLRLLSGFQHLVGSGFDPADDSSPIVVSGNDSGSPEFSSLTKTLLDGWQLSGITTYQTGTPFSVINGGDADGTGTADNAGVGDGLGVGSYVDVVGGAHGPKPFVAPGANIGPLLLNPNAFAAPRGLTFGNAGRNSLNNPSRINFNLSLFKHFKPWGDRRDIEFRVEGYNIFNHTQFRITDPSNPGNTGNNVVNCYGTQTEFYSAGASGCLAGNSFLHPVDAHDPRILQFSLKLAY